MYTGLLWIFFQNKYTLLKRRFRELGRAAGRHPVRSRGQAQGSLTTSHFPAQLNRGPRAGPENGDRTSAESTVETVLIFRSLWGRFPLFEVGEKSTKSEVWQKID